MYLQQVLNGISYEVIGNDDVEISSLSCDTSNVRNGTMFFCLKGSKVDGHDLFRKAVGDGAVAIVCEHPLDTEVLQIVVKDSRRAMALCAKNFFGNCADRLKIIAVLGTNGKTSVTYLLDSVMQKAGYVTGVIGTNGIFVNGKRFDNPLTTPDPIQLHYWLKQMYLNKVQVVIMEVSAHAVALNKMQGIITDVAIFTNFSRDHLDYFGTMQRYGETKRSYFNEKYTRCAVVNNDDQLGKVIVEDNRIPTVTYGLNSADVTCSNLLCTASDINYNLACFDEQAVVSYNLAGKFNVYNTLAVTACAKLFGIDLDTIIQGINNVKRIDGRNETIIRSDNVRIVVDFAHTPDGIDNILGFLKSTCNGKLIVVFGCGGNRDKLKRPIMAESVSKYADFAIITNDNPRYEDPVTIANEVVSGITCNYKVILNRSQATQYALNMAIAGDTVAILGKGAEKYQEIKGHKYPYSDVDVVRKLIDTST